jgi:hypothetical protein
MITVILFGIIICVLLIFLNTWKERFNSDIIKFLSINHTCEILKNVNYKYNILDIKLRAIPKHYKKDIYKFYCDNLLDFNSTDKKLINWLITGINKKLPDNLKFMLKNMKIAKFKNNIENGFPHTNYDIIFLTDSFINSLFEYYNNNNIDDAIKNIGVIIIHECVHIWQRRSKDVFNDLYKNYWRFVKVDKIYNSNYLDTIKRFNPDGVDTNWIFKLNGKYILFISIYSKDAVHIGHVDYVGIYLEKSGNKYIIPKGSKKHNLINMKEFKYFFKDLYGNHYHPNEISAELLSIYYMKIMGISHHNYSNIAYKNMLLWLKKLI